MSSTNTHLDHTDLYNHSSPSSTTTGTAVSTGPTSTPAIPLLDASLVLDTVCNDTNVSSYSHTPCDDLHTAAIIQGSQSPTPFPLTPISTPDPTKTTATPTTNDLQGLVPGLTLPAHATGTNTKGRAKRGRPPASEASSSDLADADILVKRQRNNIAAKKYRQKKIDRIEELELEVDEIKKERDGLRIELAKREAETAALREMLKMATSGREKV